MPGEILPLIANLQPVPKVDTAPDPEHRSGSHSTGILKNRKIKIGGKHES